MSPYVDGIPKHPNRFKPHEFHAHCAGIIGDTAKQLSLSGKAALINTSLYLSGQDFDPCIVNHTLHAIELFANLNQDGSPWWCYSAVNHAQNFEARFEATRSAPYVQMIAKAERDGDWKTAVLMLKEYAYTCGAKGWKEIDWLDTRPTQCMSPNDRYAQLKSRLGGLPTLLVA